MTNASILSIREFPRLPRRPGRERPLSLAATKKSSLSSSSRASVSYHTQLCCTMPATHHTKGAASPNNSTINIFRVGASDGGS